MASRDSASRSQHDSIKTENLEAALEELEDSVANFDDLEAGQARSSRVEELSRGVESSESSPRVESSESSESRVETSILVKSSRVESESSQVESTVAASAPPPPPALATETGSAAKRAANLAAAAKPAAKVESYFACKLLRDTEGKKVQCFLRDDARAKSLKTKPPDAGETFDSHVVTCDAGETPDLHTVTCRIQRNGDNGSTNGNGLTGSLMFERPSLGSDEPNKMDALGSDEPNKMDFFEVTLEEVIFARAPKICPEDQAAGHQQMELADNLSTCIGVGLAQGSFESFQTLHQKSEAHEDTAAHFPRAQMQPATTWAVGGGLAASYGYYSNGRIAINRPVTNEQNGGSSSGGVGSINDNDGDNAGQSIGNARACLFEHVAGKLKVASFDGSGGDDDIGTQTFHTVQIGCGINMGTGGGPREVFFTKTPPQSSARQYIGTVDYQETEVDEPELKEVDDIVPVVSFMQVMEAKITITWSKQWSYWKIHVPRPFAHWFSKDECVNLNWFSEDECEKLKHLVDYNLPTVSDKKNLGELVHAPEHAHIIEFLARRAGSCSLHKAVAEYALNQFELRNQGLKVGDRVTFTDRPVQRDLKKMVSGTVLKDKKARKFEGVTEGVICRVPPPIGRGIFVRDVLAQSYVVMTAKEKAPSSFEKNKRPRFKKARDIEFERSGLMDIRFFQVPVISDISLVGGSRSWGKSSRVVVSPRLVQALAQVVRYWPNPISAALASSYAFRKLRHSQNMPSGQKRHLKSLELKFSEMACDLVQWIDGPPGAHHCLLLPNTKRDLRLFPFKQKRSDAAIELALARENRAFTQVDACEQHINTLWKGAHATRRRMQWPFGGSMSMDAKKDVFEFQLLTRGIKWAQSVGDLIRDTSRIDLLFAPISRFITAMVFLMLWMGFHHWVVFSDDTRNSPNKFTSVELVFITISFGFVVYEVEEATTAVKKRRGVRYFKNVWNQIDWALDVIFLYYFVCRTQAIVHFDSANQALAKSETDHALRYLSFNCIFMWMRLLNALTIQPTLGPMIRMMTLMTSKVVTFLVLLFMFIIGFAGTFHVWFRDVVKDDASDLEELRVDIINSLGADQNIRATPKTDLEPAGYDTMLNSVLTLFSASLGDFSFDEIRKEQAFFGPVLLILYLFVGAIMLLNLLIAILSSIYDDVQQQGVEKEHAYAKTQAVVEYGIYWEQQHTTIPLPPPLNLMTVICWPFSMAVSLWNMISNNGRLASDVLHSFPNAIIAVLLPSLVTGPIIYAVSLVFHLVQVVCVAVYIVLGLCLEIVQEAWEATEYKPPGDFLESWQDSFAGKVGRYVAFVVVNLGWQLFVVAFFSLIFVIFVPLGTGFMLVVVSLTFIFVSVYIAFQQILAIVHSVAEVGDIGHLNLRSEGDEYTQKQQRSREPCCNRLRKMFCCRNSQQEDSPHVFDHDALPQKVSLQVDVLSGATVSGGGATDTMTVWKRVHEIKDEAKNENDEDKSEADSKAHWCCCMQSKRTSSAWVNSEECLSSYVGAEDNEVSAVACLADGIFNDGDKLLAIGGNDKDDDGNDGNDGGDNKVVVYVVAKNGDYKELRSFKCAKTVTAIALSKDGTRLAIGGNDKKVIVYGVAQKREESSPERCCNRLRKMFCCRKQCRNSQQVDSPHVFDHEKAVTAISLSKDGTRLAIGGDDGMVVVYDVSQKKKIWSTDACIATSSMAWSADGKHLAIGGDDGMVVVYDVGEKKKIWSTDRQAKVRVVTAVAWSANGKRLAIGGDDGMVVVYSIAKNQEESSREWCCKMFCCRKQCRNDAGKEKMIWSTDRQAKVRDVSWSHDGSRLAVGGNDVKVVVYDFPEGLNGVYVDWWYYSTPVGAVNAMAWSTDGTQLAVGGMEAEGRLKKLNLAIKRLKQRCLGCLTGLTEDAKVYVKLPGTSRFYPGRILERADESGLFAVQCRYGPHEDDCTGTGKDAVRVPKENIRKWKKDESTNSGDEQLGEYICNFICDFCEKLGEFWWLLLLVGVPAVASLAMLLARHDSVKELYPGVTLHWAGSASGTANMSDPSTCQAFPAATDTFLSDGKVPSNNLLWDNPFRGRTLCTVNLHRMGMMVPFFSYAAGDTTCHDTSSGRESSTSVTCLGGGVQLVLYDYMKGYLEFDVPLKVLEGAKFRMLCTGLSITALWSASGPAEYCSLVLQEDVHVGDQWLLESTLPPGATVQLTDNLTVAVAQGRDFVVAPPKDNVLRAGQHIGQFTGTFAGGGLFAVRALIWGYDCTFGAKVHSTAALKPPSALSTMALSTACNTTLPPAVGEIGISAAASTNATFTLASPDSLTPHRAGLIVGMSLFAVAVVYGLGKFVLDDDDEGGVLVCVAPAMIALAMLLARQDSISVLYPGVALQWAGGSNAPGMNLSNLSMCQALPGTSGSFLSDGQVPSNNELWSNPFRGRELCTSELHRTGVFPFLGYDEGSVSCHDMSSGHDSSASIKCYGGGVQVVVYTFAKGYFQFDVPLKLLEGKRFRMLCTGMSLTAVIHNGATHYCSLVLEEDVDIAADQWLTATTLVPGATVQLGHLGEGQDVTVPQGQRLAVRPPRLDGLSAGQHIGQYTGTFAGGGLLEFRTVLWGSTCSVSTAVTSTADDAPPAPTPPASMYTQPAAQCTGSVTSVAHSGNSGSPDGDALAFAAVSLGMPSRISLIFALVGVLIGATLWLVYLTVFGGAGLQALADALYSAFKREQTGGKGTEDEKPEQGVRKEAKDYDRAKRKKKQEYWLQKLAHWNTIVAKLQYGTPSFQATVISKALLEDLLTEEGGTRTHRWTRVRNNASTETGRMAQEGRNAYREERVGLDRFRVKLPESFKKKDFKKKLLPPVAEEVKQDTEDKLFLYKDFAMYMAFSHPLKPLVDTRKVAELSIAYVGPSDTDKVTKQHNLSIEHQVMMQKATGGDKEEARLLREIEKLKKDNKRLEMAIVRNNNPNPKAAKTQSVQRRGSRS